eukprot:7695459-Pyramimonas_sp.AAC.1
MLELGSKPKRISVDKAANGIGASQNTSNRENAARARGPGARAPSILIHKQRSDTAGKKIHHV